MSGKFIEGRYLDLPAQGFDNNPAPVGSTDAPQNFAPVPTLQYSIAESTGVVHKRSQVATGAQVKSHRNFRWLPWIPGRISYVPLAGDDVLTGPFTGCWVVIFDLNGTMCVGHVGTELTPEHSNSVQAREAWASAVASKAVRPVCAFNPVHGLPMKFDGAPTFYALIRSQQEMYSVVLTKPFSGGNPLKQKIASVNRVTPVAKPPFQK